MKQWRIPMYRTLKEWVQGKIKEGLWTADEISRHGCSGGFGELTYYRETGALHDLYEGAVWESLADSADECGMSIPEFLASLKITVGSLASLKNDLVWLAVERLCHELMDQQQDAADAAEGDRP
jgi:hypothetical protein